MISFNLPLPERRKKDVEQYLSDIVQVQIKEIQAKIVHFEKLELLLEKERQQLQYMKDLLFADQWQFCNIRLGHCRKGTKKGRRLNSNPLTLLHDCEPNLSH